MSKLLLDTHVLLWLLDPAKLHNIGNKTRHTIEGSEVHSSSISTAEIQMKLMTGKLKLHGFDETYGAKAGIIELALSSKHAFAIENYQSLVGHDPFDRILLAQAESEGMIFLTADQRLLNLRLSFVKDASC